MKNYDRERERLRAQFIIENAERDGLNVQESLRRHFVASSIVEELIGEYGEYSPKPKKPKADEALEQWARNHVGQTTCPADITQNTGWSITTTTKFVSARRDWFTKIKNGVYLVRNADLERMED